MPQRNDLPGFQPGDSPIRILLTDGQYKHTLALSREFHHQGHLVSLVGDKYSANRFSKYSRYFPISTGSARTGKLSDDFLSHLDQNHYDLLIPIGAASVELFSINYSILEKFANVELPSRKIVTTAFDKFLVSQIAHSLGISTPETMTADEWLFKSPKKPGSYVIKNRFEFGERLPTQYFQDSSLVTAYLKGTPKDLRENLLVQTRILGRGEGFFAVYKKGALVDGYTHKRIREIPIEGGSSTCAETSDALDTFQAGKLLLDSLEWHGPAMVEFKREVDSNSLFLMEVNPKFWGSLELGIAAGLNFPKALLGTSNGAGFTDTALLNKRYVRFQWPFDGDLAHLKYPKLRIFILKDFFNIRVKKNFDLSDPGVIFAKLFFFLAKSSLVHALYSEVNKFVFRLRGQGLSIALWRFVEESFGIPIFRGAAQQQLMLGPQLSKLGKLKLKLMGVGSSVNLQQEFDDIEANLDFESHLHLPTPEYEPISDAHLRLGIQYLGDELSTGKRIYIHCREGVSRAPSLVVAYLISTGTSLDEALSLTRKRRPFVSILPNQLASIKNFFDLSD